MAESIVYLIGAGPGNPELITVRGLQCLADADVVLYDHLVHPRLLRAAKPTAEKIDVGMPAPTPLDQEAICYLLAEKAVEGTVCERTDRATMRTAGTLYGPAAGYEPLPTTRSAMSV